VTFPTEIAKFLFANIDLYKEEQHAIHDRQKKNTQEFLYLPCAFIPFNLSHITHENRTTNDKLTYFFNVELWCIKRTFGQLRFCNYENKIEKKASIISKPSDYLLFDGMNRQNSAIVAKADLQKFTIYLLHHNTYGKSPFIAQNTYNINIHVQFPVLIQNSGTIRSLMLHQGEDTFTYCIQRVPSDPLDTMWIKTLYCLPKLQF
jgi:hypothetical protein